MTAPIDPADFTAHTAPRAAEINERFKRLYDALDKAKMGLGPESFKDGAFTAAKFPAAQAWQTVALAGGFGFSPADLSYYKDQVGLVHFRPEGFTFTTNVAVGTLLATLPTGYRPGTLIYTQLVQVVAAGKDTRFVLVDTDGTVKMGGGSALGTQVPPAGSVFAFCDHGFRAEG
jgi:hypothetical protein